MDKKNFINKVKELFSEVEETTEMKFVDVKTTEGMILRVDDLTPEMKVQEVTEEGLIDVEDGEYVLEDGLTLVIMDSMIKEIVEAPVEEEKDEVTETESITEEMSETVKVKAEEHIVEIEKPEAKEPMVEYVTMEMFAELVSQIDMLKAEVEMLKTEKEVAMSEVEKVKEEFSVFRKEPSDKPLNKKYDFNAMSKDEKLKALRR